MADNVNNKPVDRGDGDRGNELDRALNEALAAYAAIEPRAGLEQRILARLESEPKSHSHPMWWRWSAAAAVLATMIATITLVWKSSTPTQPPVATRSSIQQPEEPKQAASSNPGSRVPHNVAGSPRKVVIRRLPPSVVAAKPKLDQFPSPQPFSAEELALVRYVQSFPKEATLVAQMQEDFDLQTQKIMNDTGPESRPSGSIQQER